MLVAGDRGHSRAVRGQSKTFVQLAGKPMVVHVIEALLHTPEVSEVYVVGDPIRLEKAITEHGCLLLAAARACPIHIVPQLSSCPVNDQLSLQVALQAEQREPETRKLLNLTFVLDTSGSMGSSQFAGPTPIALQREAVRVIAAQLREGDIVSMVTWNTSQRELLGGHVVTEPSDPVILTAIDATSAAGGTDLHGGLVRGYELAARHRSPDRINPAIVPTLAL